MGDYVTREQLYGHMRSTEEILRHEACLSEEEAKSRLDRIEADLKRLQDIEARLLQLQKLHRNCCVCGEVVHVGIDGDREDIGWAGLLAIHYKCRANSKWDRRKTARQPAKK